MPPKSRGWSVLTRPPKTSGNPVSSETERTGTPAARRCAAVPPVERVVKPCRTSARARSTRPLRSETDRRARRSLLGLADDIWCFRLREPRDGARVAACALPDPGEEARREREDRVVGLARRRGAELGRREPFRIGERVGRVAVEARGREAPRVDLALGRQRRRELVHDAAQVVERLLERLVVADRLRDRPRAPRRGRAVLRRRAPAVLRRRSGGD